MAKVVQKKIVVLGMDVGASHTRALLVDSQGQVLGVGRAGSGNWESVGLEGAREAYTAALEDALADAGLARAAIAASAYGLAGLDWPSDVGRLEPVIRSLGLPGPRQMVNDVFLLLRAGTSEGVGLAAIAGSGTKVVGRNADGRTAATLGASYPFTDWGGAWDIAAAAVHAVTRAHFGMGPQTELAQRLCALAGVGETIELLEAVMRRQIVVGGRFAPQVFECAAGGDAVAQGIVRRVGESVAANVLAVARELDMLGVSFDLVTAGGVFSSRSPILYQGLSDVLEQGGAQAQLVPLNAPPVVGALLLALDLLDLPALPERALLAERVTRALERGAGGADG
jgi:N-acetylglucosamine kinase-like BadF-type ATPase